MHICICRCVYMYMDNEVSPHFLAGVSQWEEICGVPQPRAGGKPQTHALPDNRFHPCCLEDYYVDFAKMVQRNVKSGSAWLSFSGGG